MLLPPPTSTLFPYTTLFRSQAVVKAAGLEMANMVFVNPYLTSNIPTRVMNQRYARRFEFGNAPARATIEVSGLPGGAHIEYTGDRKSTRLNSSHTVISYAVF